MAITRSGARERVISAQQRRTSPRAGLPLLVAWAGSEAGSAVADTAAFLAETLGERVIFGTVASGLGPPIFPSDRVSEEAPGCGSAGSERAHATAQCLRDRGVEVTEVTLGGDPADALAAEAVRHSARVIIIGRRDAERVVPPLHASMIERLAYRSPCPVRVVPRSCGLGEIEVIHDLREPAEAQTIEQNRERV